MPTSTDLEQVGRDTNIVNHYLGEDVDLLDISEYGRLGQALIKLLAGGGTGPQLTYGGRVDTYEDLLEVEGVPNVFYFVGPEDSIDFVEYIWAEADGGTGHWDRVGGVSFIIDAALSTTSTNPVQNRIVTAAVMAKLNASVVASEYNDLGAYVIGDYCLHQDNLYKALANVTAEVWDSSKWQQTTVMAELLAALAVIPDAVTVNAAGDITIGSQLVRKVITQTEYDALTTKDPKVEYLILEETETEGE